jgi:membrane protease subunit (stomatin/prohibitin family)
LIAQDSRGDFTALGGQPVTVCAGDLADQAMGTQQPQQTRDPRRSAMLFFVVTGGLGIKMSDQIEYTRRD